jgi:hypothetical protein
MLVVIEHTQQAPILLGKRSRHRQRIDRAVDDKQGAAGGRDHLLAVGHDDPRHMDIRRMVLDKDGMTRFVVGDERLGARHDAAAHRDFWGSRSNQDKNNDPWVAG